MTHNDLKGLKHVTSGNVNLAALSLRGCSSVGGAAFLSALATEGGNVDGGAGAGAGADPRKEGSTNFKLKQLYLDGATHNSVTLRGIAVRQPHIEALGLQWCSNIDETEIASLGGVSMFPHLRMLNLGGCRYNVNDHVLASIAAHATGLSEIVLEECSLVTHGGLNTLYVR